MRSFSGISRDPRLFLSRIFSLAVFFFSLLLFPPQLIAAAPAGGDEKPSDFEVTLGYGYRKDELSWNIAGTPEGTDPNILSELTWSDLVIHQLSIGVRTPDKKRLYLKAGFNYGWIVDGENRDSDYQEDNRQDEFSRSVNRADNGNTYDFSIALGYPVLSVSNFLSMAPLIGYSYHRQKLRLTDGYQVIPPEGSFSGLDSTYNAKWLGPWIGMEVDLGLKKISSTLRSWELCFSYEHHWATYYAAADWNLRSDFLHPKSFEHETNGQGDRLTAGVKGRLSESTTLGIIYDAQRWTTQSGVDRVFLTGGQVLETRLNEVNWNSSVLRIEIVVEF